MNEVIITFSGILTLMFILAFLRYILYNKNNVNAAILLIISASILIFLRYILHDSYDSYNWLKTSFNTIALICLIIASAILAYYIFYTYYGHSYWNNVGNTLNNLYDGPDDTSEQESSDISEVDVLSEDLLDSIESAPAIIETNNGTMTDYINGRLG